MSSCKYLVIFYAVSAGQNGPNLGADEEEIVLIVYLILDVANNKIVGVHQFPVRPSGVDINENILSEEVTEEYGLTEADIKKASPLDEVIDHFDQVVHDDLGGSLTFVTDGQLHLRQCLFPEVTRKNLSLPSYYQRFHDLRKEYQSAKPGSVSINGVDDMLSDLGYNSDSAPDAAIRQVNNISRILQKLLSDGTRLHEPEPILQTLEQGIRSRGDEVDTNCVVRARGLPWQASDTDIARFFSGLNVAPGGVALCLSAQGRRNGEALVLFESANHRDMALRRHKHHIGNRYIEVYKATGEDFISIAGGNNSEAKAFLARGGQVIIRMRGLPYDCTAKQVIDFFNSSDDACKVLEEENGVLFVKKPDGRATGDAFVLFADEGDGEKALQKHKEIIGSRYIELFRSTTAEVQQVLNRSTEPTKHSSAPSSAPLIHTLPPVPPMAVIPQQMITAGVRKDCIRLRGLPYESQVEHILEFLGDHAKNIVYQGVHMVFNAQGQPSGEAFIQMDSEASAFSAANQRHHRYMVFGKKQRYIEVFQCSGEDMSMVLTGGVGGPPPPAVKSPLISPGGTLLAPSVTFPFSSMVPTLTHNIASMPHNTNTRPATPGTFNPFPGPMIYWPYPSPPISPTNYFNTLPGGVLPPHVNVNGHHSHSTPSLLTPTSSISSLSNGVASPSPPVPPQGATPSTLLTVENVNLHRGIDQRPTGEAVVAFPSLAEAERAISEKHRTMFHFCYLRSRILTLEPTW